jgi:hypothetical protein
METEDCHQNDSCWMFDRNRQFSEFCDFTGFSERSMAVYIGFFQTPITRITIRSLKHRMGSLFHKTYLQIDPQGRPENASGVVVSLFFCPVPDFDKDDSHVLSILCLIVKIFPHPSTDTTIGSLDDRHETTVKSFCRHNFSQHAYLFKSAHLARFIYVVILAYHAWIGQ